MREEKLAGEFILRIVSGPKAQSKFIIKDKIRVGNRPDCDIKLEAKELEAGQEVFRIENISGVYVFKSGLKTGILVAAEQVQEKILEPQDSIDAFGMKFIFQKPSLFLAISEMLPLAELRAVLKNNFRRLIGIVILLALFLAAPYFFYSKIAVFPIKGTEAVKTTYSEEQLVDLIADARRRYSTAILLYRDSDKNKRNLTIAMAEWGMILLMFKDIEPKPQIYYEAKEAFKKADLEKEERIKYLKNNAYVAYKLGANAALENILTQIMVLIIDPASEDYIWAKKKLLGLYSICTTTCIRGSRE